MKRRDHGRSIIAVCEGINGAINGSGDPMSSPEIQEDVSWLRSQLEVWTPSKPGLYSTAYDGAVRMLVVAAIQLGESRLPPGVGEP